MWIAVALLAMLAIATLLGGSLTTEGKPTNSPESERADDVKLAAFPPDPSTAVSDIVVIRSEEYTVDSQEFKAFVRGFVEDNRISALARARTYLDDESAALVSDDRHATIVPLAILEDGETEAIVEKVEAVDQEGAFAVSVTGDETLDPGVGSTARIITGAALIIVAVFAGFARGDLIMFQQMGFGVAAALLVDATIIRSVLLPSVIRLLGDWNWYLPRWLEWLPRLQVEGAGAARSEHAAT
jgi:hypothetical protein